MISVSNNFKTEITKPRTIDGKVIVGNRTLTSSQVNYIRRVFNTSLFKTIVKQVEIDSNEPIDKGETVNPQFGLLINNSFEYVSLGNYKAINEPILNKDTNSYQISSCDKIVESMVPYTLTTSDITYPCTVRQLFVAIFTKLGWSTSGIPSTFINSTSIIEEDVYSNVNFTYRDVLDELCTISCMFLVDKGNPTLIQKTTTNETINEQFMKSTNVAVKEKVFFNSLVFSRAEGSDNIYRKDDTSIATNGLHEFKVSDLQILSLNWRDNFINAMWNYIKTFEYYSYEIDTYGIIYLEPVDLFTISTFGDTYNTILLNSDLIIGNGASEKIYADTPKETTTEYQYATDTDRKINQTYLIVDKQQGQINAVVSQVDEIETDLSSPTQKLSGTYFDIDNALDEPLVDFSMEGQTEQDSTTGKNKLDLSNFTTQTSQGITLTPTFENGLLQYITSSGTYSGTPTYITLINTQDISASTQYILSGAYSASARLRLREFNSNNTQLSEYFDTGSGVSFTTKANVDHIIVQCVFYATNNVKFYPMIRLASITDNTYEPYTNGASPNPVYPQDIHCVSGDNTIKIVGKNLFKYPYENTTITKNGITFTDNGNGSITINGTATAQTIFYISGGYWRFDENAIIEKGTYTISLRSNNTNIFLGINTYGANGDNAFYRTYSDDKTTFTINTIRSMSNARIVVNSGEVVNNLTVYPQLEKGSSKTDFEPYQEQSQLISLGVENLFDKDNANILNAKYGTTITADNNERMLYIPCKPNTTYTLYHLATSPMRNTIGTTQTLPAVGVTIEDGIYSSTSPKTITTNSNAKYIVWQFYAMNDTSHTLQEILDSIQIEYGNKKNSYSPFGTTPIELLKIGNYKDYIHRQDNRWYLHKEIGKVVLNGSESWTYDSSHTRFYATIYSTATMVRGQGLCNYYRYGNSVNSGCFDINVDKKTIYIFTPDSSITTTSAFKTWLSTHNTKVYYVLEEPTDTEITGTLLEQLNRLMTLPLYKEMTHITIEPNDLTPIMNIEYVRDTAINSQFVRQPQLNNYYTRTETTAQIQIGNASIKQDVTEIQTTLDNNGNAISSLSSQVQNLQTSTSQQINVINQTLENGVEKLTNSLVTIDINGINTSKDNETFNTQITNKTFEVKDGDNRMGFMGFDTDKQKMLVEFPEMQTQKLTNAYHTTEKITEDELLWSADFYVGDDN